MPKDYMELLALNHPGVSASCDGDTTVYANITWHDPAVTEATLDSEYLSVKKAERYGLVDLKTGGLIFAGFSFDGQTFSCSGSAQDNWNSLKNSESDFTWPVEISTINNDIYNLAQTDLSSFWTTGRDFIKGHLDSGRALKKSIFDATTEAEVDAVVDNR